LCLKVSKIHLSVREEDSERMKRSFPVFNLNRLFELLFFERFRDTCDRLYYGGACLTQVELNKQDPNYEVVLKI